MSRNKRRCTSVRELFWAFVYRKHACISWTFHVSKVFLLPSKYCKMLYSRNFLTHSFDGFTCFEMSWIQFNMFRKHLRVTQILWPLKARTKVCKISRTSIYFTAPCHKLVFIRFWCITLKKRFDSIGCSISLFPQFWW